MTTPQESLLTPGQVFATRYRVERFLAQGGMGAVYVAEHTSTERRVALKVLFAHTLASDKSRQSFELEARVANRVQSEHVVQVLDAGIDTASRSPFLVMELLEGHDLDRHLLDHGPMPAARVMTCLRQVASALDKAHGYRDREGNPQPIIHRDLKPENLFLTRRESGEDCVKILDFGIAKVLGQQTKITQDVRGTPLFMAPEQIQGQRVGPATDIWALGLIAHQLLSGRSYWRSADDESASVMALFAEILSLPLDAPSLRLAERGLPVPWPAAFDAWFQRCVWREPGARFASAGEAVQALALALGVDLADRATRSSFAPAASLPPATMHSAAAEAMPAIARSTPSLRSDTTSGGALSRSLSVSTPPPPPARSRLVPLALLAVAGLAVAGTLTLHALSTGGSGASALAALPTPSAEPVRPVVTAPAPALEVVQAPPAASSAAPSSPATSPPSPPNHEPRTVPAGKVSPKAAVAPVADRALPVVAAITADTPATPPPKPNDHYISR